MLGIMGAVLALGRPARSQEVTDDGLEVSGLRGQIARESVARVFDARMTDLLDCALRRREGNELIAGTLSVALVIAPSGRVSGARVAASTLGDRQAERCVIETSSSFVFPAPTGGEAEVTHTFTLPLESDVRPPLAWDEARIRASLSGITRALGRCPMARGSVRVTAFVGPGGRLIGAGASASTPAADGAIDCALAALGRATFPEPGSYPAKVTFDLAGR